MHWETYKTLTKKQKEEYDFRFKDKLFYPNFVKTGRWTLAFVAIITINMFVLYLVMTDPTFADLKDQVGGLLNITIQLAKWGLIIMLIDLAWNGINMCIKFYQEYKWIKKENIIYNSPLVNWLRKKGWTK